MPVNFKPRGPNSKLNRPGVYQIRRVVDGTVYVGGSKNLRLRVESHKNRLRAGKHRNKPLQDVWDAFGEAAFVFEPLLFCSAENVRMYEQRAIDASPARFNVSATADRTSGHSLTAEAKAQIAKNRARVFVEFNGERRSLKSVCDELGVGYKDAWRRMKEQGVPFPDCLQPRRVANKWVVGGPASRRA